VGVLYKRVIVRIGLVLQGDLDMLSGGFLYDRIVVRYLREHGDDVEVFPLPWGSYPRCLRLNLSSHLAERLSRAEVDVLVQDELSHPSLFLVNRHLKRRGAGPIISIVHHPRCMEARTAWKNLFYRQIERKYLRSVDGFIFNSRETRAAVASLTGPGKPSVVAYPGGDRFGTRMTEEAVAARSDRDGLFRIIFLGNVIPRKGLHTLVAALACLDRVGWHLSVVGNEEFEDGYTGAVKQAIRRAGMESFISFHGAISDGALAGLLAQSHVLAVPSSYEGFGIVYLEAMGFGLPVIASDRAGGKELVKHGVNGFLVRPEDAAALTRYLSMLMADRKRLDAMSQAALRDFACHPTWAETGRRIQEFLHSVAPPE
jgi:glycosyltransferase involved in cell wall biosynthesis